MSTAAVDYITDHGDFTGVEISGPITSTEAFTTAIASFYVKRVPTMDPWNTPYEGYTGTAVATLIAAATGTLEPGNDDFAMLSYGRGGPGGTGVTADDYTATNPEGGMYTVSSMQDFNNDLVCWNGTWVVGPKTNVGS